MPKSGRQPQADLSPRNCVTCGEEFQPYRSHQIACSRRCREHAAGKSPRWQAWRLDCKDCGDRFEAMWSGLGTQPSCPPCTKAKLRANEERKNVARRIAVNPKRREVNRRQNLLHNHGVTLERFEKMSAEQGGVCVICGSPPHGVRASYSLHVDHDHVTGRKRQLLCTRCNQGIGYFQDDPVLLRAAADYIDRHRTTRRSYS